MIDNDDAVSDNNDDPFELMMTVVKAISSVVSATGKLETPVALVSIIDGVRHSMKNYPSPQKQKTKKKNI